MEILLSVIVPFHNDAKHIGRCLDALQAQMTDRRIECILVDDGSSDQSPEMAAVFRDRFADRVCMITQENRGAGAARNAALRASRGEYVGFVDSDDRIAPDMFTQMLDTAVQHDADVVICDFFKVFENGGMQKFEFLQTGNDGIVPDRHKAFVFETGFSTWNKIIRKSLFTERDLYFAEGILHQDIAVLPAVLAGSNKIINVSKPLYYHYMRTGSSVRTWSDRVYDILKALDQLKARLSRHYANEMEYLAVRELFYHVLPSHARRSKDYRMFFEAAVAYFEDNFPEWRSNPYVRNSGLTHRVYLALVIRGMLWPVWIAVAMKTLKTRWRKG